MRCHWEAICAYYHTLPYLHSHLRKKGNCMLMLIQRTCFEVLIWSIQLASTSYQLVETVNILAQRNTLLCRIVASEGTSTQVPLKTIHFASQDGGVATGCYGAMMLMHTLYPQ